MLSFFALALQSFANLLLALINFARVWPGAFDRWIASAVQSHWPGGRVIYLVAAVSYLVGSVADVARSWLS